MQARVFLVGAGPGDPRLITLRGRECLARADVVLFDYLANAELLKFAPRGAELIGLGTAEGGRALTQAEVEALMVAAARDGKCVVRLKGGDPGVFGRLAEEAAALRAAGIPFEVVPGVSTALAAAAYAGVAVTSRGNASCAALVTGRLQAGAPSTDQIDFAGLAAFPGTLVFYMGVDSASQWCATLVEYGKPASTPVCIVRRCSLADQQTWATTLGELPQLVERENLAPPLVAIVGDVALKQELGAWFTDRALFGQTILVTRPEQKSSELATLLADHGATVVQQPAIEIGPPSDPLPLRAAIANIDQFAWIVFASRNGVEYFFAELEAQGRDARALGRSKLAVIGPATAEALADRHLRADLHPESYQAEALAAVLGPQVAGRRVLLVRASRGREVLGSELAAAGADVKQVVAYESRDVTTPEPEIARLLAAGRVDWTTVTSSAIARSLVGLFGEHLRQTRLVAISPLTAGVLDELGYPAAAVATDFTSAGLLAAMVAADPA